MEDRPMDLRTSLLQHQGRIGLLQYPANLSAVEQLQ